MRMKRPLLYAVKRKVPCPSPFVLISQILSTFLPFLALIISFRLFCEPMSILTQQTVLPLCRSAYLTNLEIYDILSSDTNNIKY